MSYFDTSKPGSTKPLRIQHERQRVTASDGVHLEPVMGARMNINVVTLDPGAVAAVHGHDEEQIGYVVSGSCEFTDGTTTWSLKPGDTYHAAPNVPHGARASAEGCVIIDAFSPARAGLKELLDG